jgi:hypothetical protein
MDTRQRLALQVARCFNRGRWFAYELGALLEKDRTIPTGKQGCFQKVKPWLTDEGVELALYIRVIDAYSGRYIRYGTAEFKNTVYKSHR